jgi:hypothetical protein
MTVYIAEFSTFGMDPNTGEALAKVPPIVPEQKLTPPVASAAFNTATRFVRVHTDAIVSIAWGTGVASATTNNMRLAANQTEYFAVNAGDQLACIVNT